MCWENLEESMAKVSPGNSARIDTNSNKIDRPSRMYYYNGWRVCAFIYLHIHVHAFCFLCSYFVYVCMHVFAMPCPINVD